MLGTSIVDVVKRAKSYEVVTLEGQGSGSPLEWLTGRLAQHPGWVTLMTFLGAAIVTVLVLGFDDRLNPTDVMTTLAGLWALFFGIMIYLLSAQDTDHIMSQISDLQTQLSRALASPDVEELEEVAAPTEEATPEPPSPPTAEPSKNHPGRRPSTESPSTEIERRTDIERPAKGEHTHQPHQRRPDTPRQLQVFTEPNQISEGVPQEFLNGWSEATGLPTTALTRTWTRDTSGHQWVFETDSARWLVFFQRSRGVGVLPLHPDPRQGSGWRDQRASRRSTEPHGAAPLIGT
jgi:hypothetical protein